MEIWKPAIVNKLCAVYTSILLIVGIASGRVEHEMSLLL